MKSKLINLILVSILITFISCFANPPEVKVQKVSFKTEDGVKIAGTLFGEGKIGIILSHMYPTDQKAWWKFAEELAKKGYLVLTYDFRGYGDSAGEKEIAKIYLDLEAAYDFMKKKVNDIVLMGASMGGTASIIVASKKKVKGLICLSAPDSFKGLDATKYIKDVTVPKMFIACKGDIYAARSVKYFSSVAKKPFTSKIFDCSKHGIWMFDSDIKDDLQKLIFKFLSEVAPIK